MKKPYLFFGAAVALQLAILAAVPTRKIAAELFGRTVTLKTAPVDPYDIMSGYYVTLSYEISRPRRLRRGTAGPGAWAGIKEGAAVYVVLEEGKDGIWSARSMHDSWPRSVPEDCVVIKGRRKHSRIVYGIESYYIPEQARQEVEGALRRSRRTARMEVKVGPFGTAKLSRLFVGDKMYEY